MATKTETIQDLKNESLTPRSTAFLLGHTKEEQEFFDCFKSGNFHHSWIITGPKGIGKATLAYRIIRYIFSLSNQNLLKDLNINTTLDFSNIENTSLDFEDDDYNDDYNNEYDYEEENVSQSTSSSNVSVKKSDILNNLDNSPLKLQPTNSIFERLLAGGLTDLKVVEREYSNDAKTKLNSEIKIEQIRELKEFFSKTSSEGGYKIGIIDCVDEMNEKSRNAILKILEEAPNKSLLILICNNYEGLLDTIKSRCRILKLKPLSDDIMTTLISEYISNISEEDVKKLIFLSEGSIGTALDFYNSNGLEILQSFYELFPDILMKKNQKLTTLLNLIGYSEIKLKIFEKVFITFINNLIKLNSNINVNFASNEVERITKYCHQYFSNSDKLFKIREEILSNFELTPLLNLDYASVVISAFERLKNVYR